MLAPEAWNILGVLRAGHAPGAVFTARPVPAAIRQALPRIAAGLGPWIVPLTILAVWQAAASAGYLTSRVLPPPSAVAQAFWRTLNDGSLIANTLVSARRALLGLVIGGGAGFLLGVLNGAWAPARLALDSSMQMLRNVPHLAIIPLVILWFGIDEEAKVFLVAIGVAFPIYLNTYHGIRTVDRGLIEMARVYGLSRPALFLRIVLPGALPSILVGLRFALGIMWLTLIVAETIASTTGIGYMTMNAREFLQTDVVVLGVIVYALLGKLADMIVKGLERLSLAWHPAYQPGAGARP